jgi:coenzyme PQQ precursor peptide PqqA
MIRSNKRLPGSRTEEAMAWTTPTLVEICIGLEINGYLPAEF